MFDGRKIESAVREVYSFLYPDKKERKKALARLDMETLVQSIRYRCETPLAYYATGSADLSMKYHGPDLFDQKACIPDGDQPVQTGGEDRHCHLYGTV